MRVQSHLCRLLLPLTCGLSATAFAADLEVGVGAGVAIDMPDAVSKDYANFGPGPGLAIPVKIGLTDNAAIRFTGRADVAFGSDRVSWAVDVDGAPVRLYSQGHWAMLAAGSLTAGPEVYIPVNGTIRPYLGAEAGPTLINTYHSFGDETQLLLDSPENDLTDPNNIDPFTTQLTLLTDAHVGLSTGDAVGMWAELGYTVAWVPESALNKSPNGLDARRSAFGWNAMRIGAGVRFGL